MDESELIFNFFYILLCICIVYPPTEFVSLGLTLNRAFVKILGSEEIDFIRYHQKRTSLTLLIHGSLPALYFFIYNLQFSRESLESSTYKAVTWNVAQRLSITTALFILTIVTYWAIDDWKRHPISILLNKFANTGQGYRTVAIDISNEFRRQNVLRMEINTITSLIATENWIIKTTPYNVQFGHQSDTTLRVNKSITFPISQDAMDILQILNIIVTSGRAGVPEFQIRINALDFKTLQDRIDKPIRIPTDIQFYRSVTDRFIEVFKQQVTKNPVFRTNQISDSCFACMLVEPNIKLQKQCLDTDENGQPLPNDRCCRNCYCQPMWCVECLARWFAARQNEYEREIWLQQKCSCPLCRAPFCLLDVCFIEKIDS